MGHLPITHFYSPRKRVGELITKLTKKKEEFKLGFSLFTITQPYTTSTAVQCILGSFSSRSTVNKDAFCLGFGIGIFSEYPIESEVVEVFLSHGPNHLACMYLCFLHGPMCIFFSFMHLFPARHSTFIRLLNLSTFPTKTSGSFPTSLLYSSLPLAISNSPLKFSSTITLISPLFVFSITSKKLCSPAQFS